MDIVVIRLQYTINRLAKYLNICICRLNFSPRINHTLYLPTPSSFGSHVRPRKGLFGLEGFKGDWRGLNPLLFKFV
jgi:hypothetical protein